MFTIHVFNKELGFRINIFFKSLQINRKKTGDLIIIIIIII